MRRGKKITLAAIAIVVLIEEAKNKHPTALKLRLRGIGPQVQTIGDGTVRLLKDKKLATINAREDRSE